MEKQHNRKTKQKLDMTSNEDKYKDKVTEGQQ